MSTRPRDEPITSSPQSRHRRGAVAVIVRDAKMLIIRRSRTVTAPGAYCFPGGGIEAGETEPEAVVRELAEELSVRVTPRRRLWESVTPWGVHLAWWAADLPTTQMPVVNPEEVETFAWLTIPEMRQLDGLLSSNHDFLTALANGHFSIAAMPSEAIRARRPASEDDAG